MFEQVSALLHPSRGAEAKKQVTSEPWNFPNDDSARPRHRVTGRDPPTPRCEDVLPPGTPEEGPSWACLLPAIRVVGRGMEDRVHGGRAALAALQASSSSGTFVPFLLTSPDAGVCASASTSGGSSGTVSPFHALSRSPEAAQPQLVPTSVKAGAGAGGKGAGRPLAMQDSASSLGPGGSCLNISTPSRSASLLTPFSSGYALDSPSALLPNVSEEGLSPPGSPPSARAMLPRPADLSRRVHGSCSYGDLCQAVMAAAPLGQNLFKEAASYRKLGASQERLCRLDSGGLLAALEGL